MGICIALHNRLGEIAQQFLRKGSKVYIEGSLRTCQWTDQNGQERYTTEIRGEQMQMLDSNRQQGEQGQGGGEFNQPRFNNNQGGYNNNQTKAATATKVVMAIIKPAQGNSYGNNNPGGFAPKQQLLALTPAPAAADLDDDLPF